MFWARVLEYNRPMNSHKTFINCYGVKWPTSKSAYLRLTESQSYEFSLRDIK